MRTSLKTSTNLRQKIVCWCWWALWFKVNRIRSVVYVLCHYCVEQYIICTLRFFFVCTTFQIEDPEYMIINQNCQLPSFVTIVLNLAIIINHPKPTQHFSAFTSPTQSVHIKRRPTKSNDEWMNVEYGFNTNVVRRLDVLWTRLNILCVFRVGGGRHIAHYAWLASLGWTHTHTRKIPNNARRRAYYVYTAASCSTHKISTQQLLLFFCSTVTLTLVVVRDLYDHFCRCWCVLYVVLVKRLNRALFALLVLSVISRGACSS